MQRRAAAVYAAVLILVAAGAYTVMGFTQAPTITLDNPDYSLSQGQELTIQDRTYRVAQVGAGSGLLEWTETNVEFTATWENESTVTVDGTEFTVRTDADATPPRVVLTEARSLDENVTTTEIDGETYVVVEENGTRQVIPEDEYLRETQGPPESRSFVRGDTVTYDNETTVVDEITNTTVTLSWTGEQTNTVRLSEGTIVSLNGQEFIPHFPTDTQVQLTSNVQNYDDQEQRLETYSERMNGLGSIIVISSLFAFLILVTSYVPSRY